MVALQSMTGRRQLNAHSRGTVRAPELGPDHLWAVASRVSLQVLPRTQLTDPIHPRFGGVQVRQQLLLRPAPAKLSNAHHK